MSGKLTPKDLAIEVNKLIHNLQGTHRQLFYKSKHLSVEFICTPTKLWTYEIYVHGVPTDMGGAELTYEDAKTIVTLTLLVLLQSCTSSIAIVPKPDVAEKPSNKVPLWN